MVSSDQPTPAPATPRARTTILLVDDQRFVGLALARLLDGETGLRAALLRARGRGAEPPPIASGPTLILQDLVMPDVDGLALVQAFRQRAATAATPVIVLSGNDDDAHARPGARGRRRRLSGEAADEGRAASPASTASCRPRPAAPAHVSRRRGATATATAPLDADVRSRRYRDEGAADPDETVRDAGRRVLPPTRAPDRRPAARRGRRLRRRGAARSRTRSRAAPWPRAPGRSPACARELETGTLTRMRPAWRAARARRSSG